MLTGDNGELTFLNNSEGSANAFDIDLAAGALTGKTGVCVDIDSSYNEGCSSQAGAAVKDGLIGCMDGFVSKFLCGLQVEVLHGDLSTVRTSGNLFYPRVLLNGAMDHDGDGQSDPAMQCWDPIECSQKCLHLEKTARHGAGAPPSCALCNQYCSNNVVSTVMDLKDALWEDVLTVGRLIAVCFGNHGIGGCICQFSMTLQPEWRKQATNKKVLCTDGDPWDIMIEQVSSMIVNLAEWGVNQLIDVANGAIHGAFGWLGVSSNVIKHICWNTKVEPDRCDEGPLTEAELQHFQECTDENFKGGLDMVCYYHRVHTICSNTELISGYSDLFTSGYQDLDSLQSQFAEAFGNSYEMFDPTLVDLMQQAHVSTLSGPDLSDRRQICDSEAFFSAMKLDQIVRHPALSCPTPF